MVTASAPADSGEASGKRACRCCCCCSQAVSVASVDAAVISCVWRALYWGRVFLLGLRRRRCCGLCPSVDNGAGACVAAVWVLLVGVCAGMVLGILLAACTISALCAGLSVVLVTGTCPGVFIQPQELLCIVVWRDCTVGCLNQVAKVWVLCVCIRVGARGCLWVSACGCSWVLVCGFSTSRPLDLSLWHTKIFEELLCAFLEAKALVDAGLWPCNHGWGATIAVCECQTCAVVEQVLDTSQVPSLCSNVQRRLPLEAQVSLSV